MKKMGASEEFHYVGPIKSMLDGKEPLSVTFVNELGGVISQLYKIRLVDLLPIKKRMPQRDYVGLVQQVWGKGLTINPREAKSTVMINLFNYATGIVG